MVFDLKLIPGNPKQQCDPPAEQELAKDRIPLEF